MADDRFNVDSFIIRLLEVGRSQNQITDMLTENEIRSLCLRSCDVYMSQPMLLELEAPIKVFGDIHGQYYDLLRWFDFVGYPPDSNYLFLGDYVDRGERSVETFCLLMAYKIKYPENFFMLRGNHECARVNRSYGFYNECKKKYSTRLWKTFTYVFNRLPVACIIDEKIFCCHGGISPHLKNFDQIRKIQRPVDLPNEGLICDLLWADPDKETEEWADSPRRVSYTFGSKVVSRFLQDHNLDLICRAHQVVEDGYEFFAEKRVVTVFSAPNYCGQFDNAGGVMVVDENLKCSFRIMKPELAVAEKGPWCITSELRNDILRRMSVQVFKFLKRI